jgi:hypothetical protein
MVVNVIRSAPAGSPLMLSQPGLGETRALEGLSVCNQQNPGEPTWRPGCKADKVQAVAPGSLGILARLHRILPPLGPMLDSLDPPSRKPLR